MVGVSHHIETPQEEAANDKDRVQDHNEIPDSVVDKPEEEHGDKPRYEDKTFAREYVSEHGLIILFYAEKGNK